MWSLKSLGEKVATGLEKGLQDLESSFQQQAQTSRPNTASPSNARSATYPVRSRLPRDDRVSPRSSDDTQRGSPQRDSAKTASELADSAITNLRSSLRKSRASLDGNGSQHSAIAGTSQMSFRTTAPERSSPAVLSEGDSISTPVSLAGRIDCAVGSVQDLASQPSHAPKPSSLAVESETFSIGSSSVSPGHSRSATPVPCKPVPTPLDSDPLGSAVTPPAIPPVEKNKNGPSVSTRAVAMPSSDPLLQALLIPLPDSPSSESTVLSFDPPPTTLQSSLGNIPPKSASGSPGASKAPSPVQVTSDSHSIHLGARPRDTSSDAVPSAYAALLEQKTALDVLISRLFPPLAGVDDAAALEAVLNGASRASAEIQRLKESLDRQAKQSLDVQRALEADLKTQSDHAERLSQQLESHDSISESLSAARERATQAEAEAKVAREGLAQANARVKVEEEKRAKSISLLKAVRQKLVQTEKDKENLEKDSANAIETAQRDRARFEAELTNLRASQESQLSKLRVSFDREINSIRAQYEREAVARKGQYELDAITAKAAYQKEVSTRDAKIAQSDARLKALSAEKDRLFEQLQLRQAQIESSTSHQDDLQGRAVQLELDLSSAHDRAATLSEEVDLLRRSACSHPQDNEASKRLLAQAEAGYRAKIEAVELRLRQIEKERRDTELEMTRSLQERLKEVEKMRTQMAVKDEEYLDSMQSMRDRDQRLASAEVQSEALQNRLKGLEKQRLKDQDSLACLKEELDNARSDYRQQVATNSDLQTRLDDILSKEASLRATTKSLRDELRKVQSGILMSENQRNPGVGYFSTFMGAGPQSPPTSSGAAGPDGQAGETVRKSNESSRSALTLAPPDKEAEVNFEYLRNTLLQFLEHKEMRPHLVRVLAVILHFTPQETRRLAAKAAS